MRRLFHSRVRIIAVACILVALVVVGRLYMVQIVHVDAYRQQASGQYVQKSGGLYNRGTIYLQSKRDQRVAGASIRRGYTVAIHPDRITDPAKLYSRVSQHLSVDREIFLRRARKQGDPYEEIAQRVSPETAEQIRELSHTGIDAYRQQWRYYPGGSLAAHTIGFVGYDGDDLVGQYGLESAYDGVLDREAEELYVNFFADIFTDVQETLFTAESERAGDVVTHLEPSVQTSLEETLKQVHGQWNSHRTAGLVIDPQTGAIHAMAALPRYNPNAYNRVDDLGRFVNPLVGHVYELGSIMKAITMAAGLDSGAVTPQETYVDRGEARYSGETIQNYDGEARGEVSMQEVLNQSLNTGAAYVANEMGADSFTRYARAFGLDERSGIDLPNEAKNLAGNLEEPRPIELATAAFGQGVAVTPVSMVRSLSAMANGGTLVTPHVAKRIDYEHGLSKSLKFPQGERVISASSSRTVSRMLVNTVDDAMGDDIGRERYSIAAKTGTAQIPDESGGYAEGKFLHSFFGYFPAYDPEYLVFLMTIEPKGARYASQTLASPFMDMANFLISYYGIPPDR